MFAYDQVMVSSASISTNRVHFLYTFNNVHADSIVGKGRQSAAVQLLLNYDFASLGSVVNYDRCRGSNLGTSGVTCPWSCGICLHSSE